MKRDIGSLVQIEDTNGYMEIRYFEGPHDERYLCWMMPTLQAEDLTRWWNKTGRHLRAKDMPEAHRRCGSVAVSACVMTRVDVRAVDSRGRPAMIGYSLPRDAVAALADKLNGRATSGPSVVKKESRSCSKRSS